MPKGFDDAVGWDDGYVLQEEGLETGGGCDVGLEGERGIHDQSVRGKCEEEGRVGVECHGVSQGGDYSPGLRGAV